VLCTFVSPYARDRDAARALFPAGRFAEVHVTASLDTLRERDTKGLYGRDAAVALTGVVGPYEQPSHAELVLNTDAMEPQAAVGKLLALVRSLSTCVS
jgi:adenylylsulfate kinase-like enzyme